MESLKKLQALDLLLVNLQLHDNTNLTTDSDLSVEMKTYYSDYLIDIAKPLLVHDQFAQKHPIPKGGGKTIEFRVKHPFTKALTPLTEGVTPSGQKLEWTKLEASISQYGGYVELSDVLLTTAIDNNLVYATENCGDQAGRTLDTITREVLNGGTSVQYAANQVAARYLLVGGDGTPANNHYMSVDAIKKAVRFLKTMMAKPIDSWYVAIIHPDVAYDLTSDDAWENIKQYDPGDWYEGEIGKIGKCRFIETTEAKIFHAADLSAANRNLGFTSNAGQVITVDEALTAGDATALVGRKVIIKGYQYTVTAAVAGAAGAATITVDSALQGAPGASDIIYPGEAGAAGRDVYSNIILGADAYGVTEISGLGLQHIVKQLGSSGTADPLNQRSSSGWKATKVAKRLVESYMVRIETACTFQSGAN